MNSMNCEFIWDELNSKLQDMIDKNDDKDEHFEESYETFQTKCKEINKLIKDIKGLNKEKEKLKLESESVEKAVIKAETNISKAEDKSQQIIEYNRKMSKKIEEDKDNIDNVMNAWNSIGLRIERKDELLSIKFNKIVENEPNKWFTVKVNLKDDNQIKVIDCEPKDSLDLNQVEERFNRSIGQNKPDLRHLIALLRKTLKQNNSH